MATRKKITRQQCDEQREYRVLEWVAALSGDFFADCRYRRWRDKYNDYMGGCRGVWESLIVTAQALATLTQDLAEDWFDFYILVEEVIDKLYSAPPWELNEGVLTAFVQQCLNKQRADFQKSSFGSSALKSCKRPFGG